MTLDRAGQQAALQEHHVGGIALDGRAQILQGIGLGHDAKIVFEREYLANANAVDRLGIRKYHPDGPRLDRSFVTFAFCSFVQNIHVWFLPSKRVCRQALSGCHCSTN